MIPSAALPAGSGGAPPDQRGSGGAPPDQKGIARLLGPRGTLLLTAAALEGICLFLWPAIHLLDSPLEPSRLGSMFLQRYALLGGVLTTTKSAVDGVFPGALWAWEHLVAFTISCFVIAFVVYGIAAWRIAEPPRGLGLRWVLLPLAIFQVTLVFVPGTMTTDIFNYAIYGQMPVLYGANPFVHTPGEFPQSPLYYLIPLYWHDAPSVYGPLWSLMSTGVAAVFRPLPLADELLFYRLIANLAHFANVALIWALARQITPEGRRAPSAALAYGWNPLLLVDFALNGHNDVLMLTFALMAILLFVRRRFLGGAFVLGASIATKYATVLVAPALFLWGARQTAAGKGIRGVARAVTLWAMAAGTVALVSYAPWIRGPETFGPVLYWAAGPRLQNFWPEPALISLAAWTSGLLPISYEAAWDTLLGAFKLMAKIAFAIYVIVEAWRAREVEDVLRASARIAVVFLLVVNTWIMAWYYAWPLAFCAALGWSSLLVRVCAGLTLTSMVVVYQRQYDHEVVGEWAGLFLALPIVLALGSSPARWLAAQARRQLSLSHRNGRG